MYETMAVWETDADLGTQSALMGDFASVWQTAGKVVYSTTLAAVRTTKTMLERSFDPDAVRAMKASAAGDLTVGGPNLAAHAFKAGLVDECHLFIVPILVGGGKPSLPAGVRAELELAGGTSAQRRCRVPALPRPRLTIGSRRETLDLRRHPERAPDCRHDVRRERRRSTEQGAGKYRGLHSGEVARRRRREHGGRRQ